MFPSAYPGSQGYGANSLHMVKLCSRGFLYFKHRNIDSKLMSVCSQLDGISLGMGVFHTKFFYIPDLNSTGPGTFDHNVTSANISGQAPYVQGRYSLSACFMPEIATAPSKFFNVYIATPVSLIVTGKRAALYQMLSTCQLQLACKPARSQ